MHPNRGCPRGPGARRRLLMNGDPRRRDRPLLTEPATDLFRFLQMSYKPAYPGRIHFSTAGRLAHSASQTCNPVVSICEGRIVIPSPATARPMRWVWLRRARIVTVPPPPAPLALNPV